MPKNVSVRLINDDEKHYAEVFQHIVKLSLETFDGQKGKGADLNKLKRFNKELRKYSNYPFVQVLTIAFKKWYQEVADIFQSKRNVPKRQEILKVETDKLFAMFSQKNISGAFEQAQVVKPLISKLEKHAINVDDYVKTKRNPLYIENPLFFGRTGLLQQFEQADMKALVEKDLNNFCWTYMPLPENKVSDYEFIAHWILELKNSPEEVELSNGTYALYSEFAYASDEFDELKSTVKEYLSSNKKSLLPRIMSLIDSIPDLKKTNDDQKKEITTVYRGIAIDNQTSTIDIAKNEQKNKYVATSISRRVARRFAYQIGHLESEDSRRSETGAIITYSVSPDAILLDTQIFGGIYNESEIVIDTSKAKIEDIAIV